MSIRDFRKPEQDINEIFLNRWSPRAMSGEEIDEKTLFTLFEAARWAPSSNNNQPWCFIYARRNTKYWNTFFNLLEEGNQVWAKNAAVLIVVASKTTFNPESLRGRTPTIPARPGLALLCRDPLPVLLFTACRDSITIRPKRFYVFPMSIRWRR